MALYRECDRVRVKGKYEPITIYEPIAYVDKASEEQRKEIALHAEALALYRDRQWGRAESQFIRLRERYGAPIYDMYLDRIRHFQSRPPSAGWDGVFEFTSK